MIDWVEFRHAVCDRYTSAEIVDTLGLTAEELYATLEVHIIENYQLFDLVLREMGLDYEEKEEEEY